MSDQIDATLDKEIAPAPTPEPEVAIENAPPNDFGACSSSFCLERGIALEDPNRMILEDINQFHFPENIDPADIPARVDHWLENQEVGDQAREFVTEFKNYAAQGHSLTAAQIAKNTPPSGAPNFPTNYLNAGNQLRNNTSNDHRAASEAMDKIPDAAAQLGVVGNSLLNTIGQGIAAPFKMVSAQRFKASAVQATESSRNLAINGQNAINGQLEQLSELGQKVLNAPEGDERNKLMENFLNTSKDIRGSNSKLSEGNALVGADPNNPSQFKKSSQDINEEAHDVAERHESILEKVAKGLSTDPENAAKVKDEAEKIQEMLKRIGQMIKSIFSGFNKDDPAPKAPAPSM